MDTIVNPEEKVYKTKLTKEGAEYLLSNDNNHVANYIKGDEVIYLRTKGGLKYDPTNFEGSLYGKATF
jgi:hypothetical protein